MKPHLCIFLLANVALISGCTKGSSEGEEAGPAPAARVRVGLGEISAGDIDVTVTATGKTGALRQEKVLSPVAGKVIVLRALEGTRVRKGDVLAVILTRESQAAISGAEALLRGAKTDAQKSEAERMLRLAENSQSRVDVHAQFDGVVSNRAVNQGELVAENAELLTVLDLSTVYFNADVPLRNLTQVHPGDRTIVEFQSLPGARFHAIVDAISPQTDVQSQTVKARLRFTRQEPRTIAVLRTEMNGTAHIITGVHRNVLLVPKTALLRNDEMNSYSVVTITPDSIARIVEVGIGTSTDSTVEVSSRALKAGMPVVVEGNYALPD